MSLSQETVIDPALFDVVDTLSTCIVLKYTHAHPHMHGKLEVLVLT